MENNEYEISVTYTKVKEGKKYTTVDSNSSDICSATITEKLYI